MSRTVIELKVNNHPGVMSHVAGLFARRAFNIEGIICGPVGDGTCSLIYLLAAESERLPQLVRQLEKLYDVLELRLPQDFDRRIFDGIDSLAAGGTGAVRCHGEGGGPERADR